MLKSFTAVFHTPTTPTPHLPRFPLVSVDAMLVEGINVVSNIHLGEVAETLLPEFITLLVERAHAIEVGLTIDLHLRKARGPKTLI